MASNDPPAASGLRSYDVTELVSFTEQPDGSMRVDPIIAGVVRDLEMHIALRDAFQQIMEARCG